MIRRPLDLAALGVLAVIAAATPAHAGGVGCCACATGCQEPYEVTPYYVVNHGPYYAGPGIVTSPFFETRRHLRHYPYIGNYYYPPYDGGPYADPIRHYPVGPRYLDGGYPPAQWREPAMTYYPPAGPRIIHVSGRNDIAPRRYAPRRPLMRPLDPRNK